jgi:hypothetical protein
MSSTTANGHSPCGHLLSTINTTSLICTFLLGWSHFWRLCRLGKYSFSQRFQNEFARNWACLHLMLYRSSPTNTPGERHELVRIRSNLL